ncbi:MAG: NlpC/P60 family protein [Acetivibrionales bacterium]|jgi:cell wall-associated NlpC family hydrolase
MMATTIDEQLKKDFDSKFNTLDHDKPSKDLKDAIREARIFGRKNDNAKTMSFVLNMPLMRALKGIYRIIKSGIEGMLGQGFDPDKDYATLIADAIKVGNYSNLQKYVKERDAKIASDIEKYKDAQTTGAYLLFLGYVSVREYLNRKGYANDQITYENGKVCVTVNGKKYPLGIAGIALTGNTNYASEDNIEKALSQANIPATPKPESEIEKETSPQGINYTADELRQQIVDLANKCVGKVEYKYKGSMKLTNSDGSIVSGLQLDCSSFTASLYFTVYGEEEGNLEKWYERVKNPIAGGDYRQSQMGVEVQNLKNSDGIINYDALKPGDLLFFDYQQGKEEIDITEHVAVYIGNGKFIDVGKKGCLINNGGGEDKTINELYWKSKNAYVRDLIISARRLIQDDGTLFTTETILLEG